MYFTSAYVYRVIKIGKSYFDTKEAATKPDGCKSNFLRLRDSRKENSVKPTRQKKIIWLERYLYDMKKILVSTPN